jgi:predicted metal-dependent HD superfamily phosphohydrolase
MSPAATDVDLHRRWSSPFESEPAPRKNVAELVFREIVNAYRSPDRHYHTLAHLAQCFEVADLLVPLRGRPMFPYAIFFHDIAYLPLSKTNEEFSAAIWEVQGRRLGLDASMIAIVSRAILLTDHAGTKAVERPFEAYVLDTDLSILGTNAIVFDEYELNVRREYAAVPEAKYREGRARFLARLAARQTLFQTKEFRDAFEERARTNIVRSIARLRRGP